MNKLRKIRMDEGGGYPAFVPSAAPQVGGNPVPPGGRFARTPARGGSPPWDGDHITPPMRGAESPDSVKGPTPTGPTPIEVRHSVLWNLERASKVDLGSENHYLEQARYLLDTHSYSVPNSAGISRTNLNGVHLRSYVQAELERNVFHQGIDDEAKSKLESEPWKQFPRGLSERYNGGRMMQWRNNNEESPYIKDKVYVKNRKDGLRKIGLELAPWGRAALSEKRTKGDRRIESIVPKRRAREEARENQERPDESRSRLSRAIAWLLHHRI